MRKRSWLMDFFRDLMYVFTCFSIRWRRQLRLQLPGQQRRRIIKMMKCADWTTKRQKTQQGLRCLTCGVSRFDLSFQLQSDACHLFVRRVAGVSPFRFLRRVTCQVNKCYLAVAAQLTPSCRHIQTHLSPVSIVLSHSVWFTSVRFCPGVCVSMCVSLTLWEDLLWL